MAAHLSHKIRWDFLVDYLSPYANQGITLPVGDCSRIHPDKKKHQIQIDMRKFITEDMICKDKDCKTTSKKTFRKNNKKLPPFNTGFGSDVDKLNMFVESFSNAVHEFASTELKSPIKPVEYEDIDDKLNYYRPHCSCSEMTKYLEFGDKQKLFEFSDSKMFSLLNCHHGQAIGPNFPFLIHHILKFYVYSNVILYLDLKEEQWPSLMKPKSRLRSSLLYDCDGQTFLPSCRQFLSKAVIDVEATREMSKRLFRFIYFYVMMQMKVDSSYKFHEEFDSYYFKLDT